MEPLTKKAKKNNFAAPITAENVLNNEDILKIVFSYLSYYDLCQASKTCRIWKQAADEEMLFRRAPECISNNFMLTGFKSSDSSYNPILLGKELRIKPELALIFEKTLLKNKQGVNGPYGQSLPTKCKTFIAGGYEVVASNAKDHSTNAVGVFLSKFIPQVYQVLMDEELSKYYIEPAPDAHTCIIVLTDHEAYDFTKKVLTALKKSYIPGSLSLWGGICSDLKFFDQKKKQNNKVKFTVIKLSDPNLQSWSVVLPRSCKSSHHIEKKLEDLKNNIQLKKYSLALMFACCARSGIMDLEVGLFKKVFPQIPLAGLNGDGEIGLNTLNKEREASLQHSYTTVFLILSYDLSHEEARIPRNYGMEDHS